MLFLPCSRFTHVFVKRAMLVWIPPPAERDAMIAKKAATKEDYHAIWKLVVQERLNSSSRYESKVDSVDTKLATKEAKILDDKISHKDYNDGEIIRILTTRSKPQMRATFKNYNYQFGTPINEDLKKKKKDEYLCLLRATTKCLSCPEKYFAKTLRLSMKGIGTDEDTLTRVATTRAEVDMKLIMEQYQRKNKKSLADDIKGDTCGTIGGHCLPSSLDRCHQSL